MNEEVFKAVLRIGRAIKTTYTNSRGGLIQLLGDKVYLLNDQRSALFKFYPGVDMGEGCFYSTEAPSNTEKISIRDERVMFEFSDKGGNRRVFVPDKGDFEADIEDAFKKDWKEPDTPIPSEFFDYILKEILLTELILDGNILHVNQCKASGTVEIQSDVHLTKGLKSAFTELTATGKAKVISMDLFCLKNVIESPIKFGIFDEHCISITGTVAGGCKMEGLLSFAIEER